MKAIRTKSDVFITAIADRKREAARAASPKIDLEAESVKEDRKMRIPKYVQEIMRRAKFARGYGDPGYTLEITKARPYTKAPTFRVELERLVAWANRQIPSDDDEAFDFCVATIVSAPTETHYCNQYATVTIYDPVMKELEAFMEKEKQRK